MSAVGRPNIDAQASHADTVTADQVKVWASACGHPYLDDSQLVFLVNFALCARLDIAIRSTQAADQGRKP